MTNIRLVYDPFEKKTRIYHEQDEMTAVENKIGTFLEANGFYSCLQPFRGRYAIWDGLLPELVSEVNDDELHIVFEGRKEDYGRVKDAFVQSHDAVLAAGYENKWELVCRENFDVGHIRKDIENLIRNLMEMCESRMELTELKQALLQVKEDSVQAVCRTVQKILTAHMDKWSESGSHYRQEKITYLEMLEDELKKLETQSNRIA